MRSSALVAGSVILAVVCAACGGADTPVAPTTTAQPAVVDGGGGQPTGTPATGAEPTAAPVGLSGVIRGMNASRGTFSLVTRAGTRTILTDRQTQVWRSGTQMRFSSLRDGQTVSIRGYDYTRYVLARTIGVN